MRKHSDSDIEATNLALESIRPIVTRTIDFKNPYYTQSRNMQRLELGGSLPGNITGRAIEHLYVHIPFCMARCFYCNYPKIAGNIATDEQQAFLDQLELEIAHHRQQFKLDQVKTIHIGGGTPNSLNRDNFIRLFDLLSTIKASEEYAVEIYPSESLLSDWHMRLMHDYGVDRISIGIQTFNDKLNELNNRIRQPAVKVFSLTEQAKRYFDNISIDLLYGMKEQGLEHMHKDLERALELDVNSIYLYQTRELIKGRPTELQQALNDFLSFFRHNSYDVVSFDQVIKKRNSNGFCRHRSGRSKGESLLGLGPGAVSEVGPYIFKNLAPLEYSSANLPADLIDTSSLVHKDESTLKREYFNRALRHFNDPDVDGLRLADYERRFGTALHEDFAEVVKLLQDNGIINYGTDRVEITDYGMLFTQQINYLLLEHYK